MGQFFSKSKKKVHQAQDGVQSSTETTNLNMQHLGEQPEGNAAAAALNTTTQVPAPLHVDLHDDNPTDTRQQINNNDTQIDPTAGMRCPYTQHVDQSGSRSRHGNPGSTSSTTESEPDVRRRDVPTRRPTHPPPSASSLSSVYSSGTANSGRASSATTIASSVSLHFNDVENDVVLAVPNQTNLDVTVTGKVGGSVVLSQGPNSAQVCKTLLETTHQRRPAQESNANQTTGTAQTAYAPAESPQYASDDDPDNQTSPPSFNLNNTNAEQDDDDDSDHNLT